jgi:CubicO group peptidase (beta-lactamase class C family)
LVWPPGEVFDYSNLGYGILGKVIERSSGLSLDSYLQKEFFGPLDMHHCTFDAASPQIALQYDEKSHKPSPLKVSGHPAASGLHCSAHDLLRFGRLHLKDNVGAHSILSTGDIDEMHSPQANTHGQYGLGWWIKQHSKYQVVYAAGGTTDSYALLELVPAQDLAVVVIANSHAKFVGDLGDKIVSALIPDFAVAETSPNNTASSAGSDGLRALAGDWIGQILADEGAVDLSIKVGADGSVRAQIGDQPPALMNDVSLKPRHFYGRMPGSRLIGEGPKSQPVLELDLALRGGELIGAATSGPQPGEDGDQLPYWVKLSRAQP